MAGSRAVSDREPGQVRKEAALSGPAHAPRTSLAGAEVTAGTPEDQFRRRVHGPLFDHGRKRTPEQVVARVMRRGLEQRRDRALIWPCSTPEIVFLSSESWPETGRYEGLEAMRTFVGEFRAVWEDVGARDRRAVPGRRGGHRGGVPVGHARARERGRGAAGLRDRHMDPRRSDRSRPVLRRPRGRARGGRRGGLSPDRDRG